MERSIYTRQHRRDDWRYKIWIFIYNINDKIMLNINIIRNYEHFKNVQLFVGTKIKGVITNVGNKEWRKKYSEIKTWLIFIIYK